MAIMVTRSYNYYNPPGVWDEVSASDGEYGEPKTQNIVPVVWVFEVAL